MKAQINLISLRGDSFADAGWYRPSSAVYLQLNTSRWNASQWYQSILWRINLNCFTVNDKGCNGLQHKKKVVFRDYLIIKLVCVHLWWGNLRFEKKTKSSLFHFFVRYLTFFHLFSKNKLIFNEFWRKHGFHVTYLREEKKSIKLQS